MNNKREFGDFQTPLLLANEVVSLLHDLAISPERVVEPTAGVGTFLTAAFKQWGPQCQYTGFEINQAYVQLANDTLNTHNIQVECRDFYSVDWQQQFQNVQPEHLLIIGNPPWVTNSELGVLQSQNLPKKQNFEKLTGLAAQTGKSNFDIAEFMLMRLIEALPINGTIAMLCKTMTARKVLRYFWKTNLHLEHCALFKIDAKAHFNVAVDACLFVAKRSTRSQKTAKIYSSLSTMASATKFGFIDSDLVADIEQYAIYKKFDGGSSEYIWRSGVKHDAAQVMEFTKVDSSYRNGCNENVDIEEEFVYPLLKSSDLGNARTTPRKHVLITQKSVSENTLALQEAAPKTWNYLQQHAQALDDRRSSIYTNRPRFSVFGIGEYSFAPWKIAISGLYKTLKFVVVPPCNKRPVMLDDTCYFIPCASESEAQLLLDLLTSEPAVKFLESLIFWDAKRPITVDLLKRISFHKLAIYLNRKTEFEAYTQLRSQQNKSKSQKFLFK